MITKMKLCHKARHSSYLAVYHSCFIRNNYAKPLFSFLYNIRNNSGQTNTSMCVEVSPACYWVAVFGLDAHGNLNDIPLTIENKGKLAILLSLHVYVMPVCIWSV